MSKKVTVTITTRSGKALAFNNTTEEVEKKDFLTIGEKFNGLERDYFGDNFTVVKIKEVDEPFTATYEMPTERFEQLGHESENYKIGCINRKIGGELSKVKLFNNATEEVEIMMYNNMTIKEIKKELEKENCVFLKEIERTKVEERYVYMDYKEFIANADC